MHGSVRSNRTMASQAPDRCLVRRLLHSPRSEGPHAKYNHSADEQPRASRGRNSNESPYEEHPNRTAVAAARVSIVCCTDGDVWGSVSIEISKPGHRTAKPVPNVNDAGKATFGLVDSLNSQDSAVNVEEQQVD